VYVACKQDDAGRLKALQQGSEARGHLYAVKSND